MERIDLHSNWLLCDPATPDSALPASVPGCVHTDLLAAGKIPDPWFRDAEKDIRWVENKDWIYQCEFAVSAKTLDHRYVDLVFEGLDTFCAVEVNGIRLLESANMHRTWEIDVKQHLVEGQNNLKLTFTSPIPYMKERDAGFRLHQWNVFHEDYFGKSYVRKMACAFGWDWGLMAPTMGIWRPCRLIARDAKLNHVAVKQSHEEGKVEIRLSPEVEGVGSLRSELSLQGERVGSSSGEEPLVVADPKLWWPNGMGDQPLYELVVKLVGEGGEVLDDRKLMIGLRTVDLVQEPDEHGKSFRFRVNGRDIFMKGGNWIPCDVFPSRISDEVYRHQVESCANSHMNMIRVWGGGIYEDERFYDLCDQHGILIWQDFMFACSGYPANDPAFMENVRHEAKDNVRRLHHRACLGIWCGNNELEQGLVDFDRMEWGQSQPMPGPDYEALFDVLLGEAVSAHDGVTPYWPSSGHTPGEGRRNCWDDRSGDAHSWDVWFGGLPLEAQRRWNFRFMSEFGFQSFPEPRTVEAFTLPEDRNLVNWVMDYHQRSGPGNMTIFKYLLDWFPVPTSFENSLWMTQMIQALCIQVAAEHARRIQGRMDGLLYWQINDLWPGATWSSIDVFGRWKALHYFARRFYQPVLVSALENHRENSMAFHVSNHRPQAFHGKLRWQATTCSGRVLADGECEVAVPSQTNLEVDVVDCSNLRQAGGIDRLPLEVRTNHNIPMQGDRDLMFWVFLQEDGIEISQNLGYFAKPKYWLLSDPGLTAKVVDGPTGPVIELTAEACAPWTRLELRGIDAVFSDNFLHLLPGRISKVTLESATPLTAKEVEAALKVTPLKDCWAVASE